MQTGIEVELTGKDGNAFNIIGICREALRKAGRGDLIAEFTDEATSGDYDHLLHVCTEWFDVQ